jgi:Flp pilus assembly protein TadD
MPFFGGRRNGNDQIGPNPAQVRRAAEAETSGITDLRDGNLAKAESTLRRALALNPQSATAHGYLALTLYRLGRYAEAVIESRDAVYLAPTDDMLQRTHGMIYEAMGRLDEAAISYLKAVELKPDNPHSHTALGSLSLKRGDLPGAENLITTALRLDPNDERAVETMAEVRRRQGDRDAAVSILGAALLNRPGHTALNFKLGQVLAEKGETEAAGVAFQKALNQKPHDAEILFALGAVMLRAGQHDEVRRLYDQAMKGVPGDKQRYEADFRSLLLEHMDSQPVEEDLPVPVPSRHTPSGRLKLDAMPALISPVPVEPAHESRPDQAPTAAIELLPTQTGVPVLTLVAAGRANSDNLGAPPVPAARTKQTSPQAGFAAKEPTTHPADPSPTATTQASSISALEAKIKGEPSNSRLYHDLSILYLRAGRLAEAMEMGRKAEQVRAGARQLERAGRS